MITPYQVPGVHENGVSPQPDGIIKRTVYEVQHPDIGLRKMAPMIRSSPDRWNPKGVLSCLLSLLEGTK